MTNLILKQIGLGNKWAYAIETKGSIAHSTVLKKLKELKKLQLIQFAGSEIVDGRKRDYYKLTFRGAIMALSEAKNSELKTIAEKYNEFLFKDASLVLKSNNDAGLWWLKTLKKIGLYINLKFLDEDEAKALTNYYLMMETVKAPIEIQENEHIQQLSSAFKTYITLIKFAEGKISLDELMESYEKLFETLHRTME